MDDFVSSKGEPSATAVNTTSATGSSMTFPQALQTMQEPDVRIVLVAYRYVYFSSAHLTACAGQHLCGGAKGRR